MKRLRSNRGQAMIELLMAAPVVALMLAGGSALLYLGFAKIWIARAAREGAVCLQSPTSQRECRSRVEQALSAGLPIGTASLEDFRKFGALARVRIVFRLAKPESNTDGENDLIDAAVSIRDLR